MCIRATGYIGGDFLYEAYHFSPTWNISVLVRSEEAAASLKTTYPTLRIVRGDLDSADLLHDEAERADIVLHFADCDHGASAKALLKGMARHTAEQPGWYIHTSGTGILTLEDGRAKTCGISREKIFDDWSGVSELINLPDDALHRNVDKIVTGAIGDSNKNFKTAIVCPCCIYVEGRGTENKSSTQVYTMATHVLERGKGFIVGEGKNIWHYVHIRDLSKLYIRLADAAAAGGCNASWDHEGYYFAESGSVFWGEISKAIAKAAFERGYIASKDLDVLDWDATEALDSKGPYRWGSNSRCHAIRARRLLGWKPVEKSLLESVEDIVDLQQARRTGDSKP